MCREHHRLSENAVGWGPDRFEREFGVDLAAEAERIGREYREAT
jgi:hypothetical protein